MESSIVQGKHQTSIQDIIAYDQRNLESTNAEAHERKRVVQAGNQS
jgi:hypothetical protein